MIIPLRVLREMISRVYLTSWTTLRENLILFTAWNIIQFHSSSHNMTSALLIITKKQQHNTLQSYINVTLKG